MRSESLTKRLCFQWSHDHRHRDREHTAFKGAQPTAVTSATVGLVTSYEAEAAATTSSKTSAPHERGQPFWIQPVTWHKLHFAPEQLKQSCTFHNTRHYFVKVASVLVPWINRCNQRCFHTTTHKVNAKGWQVYLCQEEWECLVILKCHKYRMNFKEIAPECPSVSTMGKKK